MKYKNILLREELPLAILTINRPEKLNALNKETIGELGEAFKVLEKNKKVRCIILTGQGDKAFVAGADIAEFAQFSPKEGKQLASQGQKALFNKIEQLKKPVIAAINGYALGGGLELALACHIRVAATQAKMGLPEVSLGLIPGYGGTQRLPQLIGRGPALELILTAGMLDTTRALALGLINHVVAPEELLSFCRKTGSQIANNSPLAIRYAIKAVNDGFKYDADGYKTEIEAFGKCFGTADFKEGTTAFLSKRKADFPGN